MNETRESPCGISEEMHREHLEDWRKGVALVYAALGEHNPPGLCCATLAEKVLALRADAERYQLLRRRAWFEGGYFVAALKCSYVRMTEVKAEKIDARVDEAIAEVNAQFREQLESQADYPPKTE
jgi:hypothetical protein